MRIKKICMRIVLCSEMILFGYIYCFGINGIKVLQLQRKNVIELENTITMLNNDVEQLEKEINVWKTNDFYKEKFAREQLQMARKGDEIFYIGN